MTAPLKSVIAALCLTAPGIATASPFDVLEEADFAQVAHLDNLNVGVASEGESAVLGFLSGECVAGVEVDCNSAEGDTQDSFNFTIAEGYELAGIGVGTEGGGPDGLEIAFAIGGFENGHNLIDAVTLPASQAGMLSSGALAAGTYSFSVYGHTADQAGFYNTFYALQFDVQAVAAPASIPLPAGLPLLAAGLGVFGLARARQRR